MVGISPAAGSQVGNTRTTAAADATAAPVTGAAPQLATIAPALAEMLKTLQSKSQQSADNSGGNLAAAYLKNTGLYTPQPLEKSVAVHQSNDSDYWTALGYDA